MSDPRPRNAFVRRYSFAFAALLGLVVTAGIWQLVSADVTGPTATDHNVTNIVTWLMEDQHLSRQPLGDEISQRGFDLFVRSWDPLKLYFYQSDIDEFSKYRTELDDMLKNKNTKFAYMVFKRFLQRVNERVAMIDELLDGEFDFTIDEEMVTDRDLRNYPTSEAEARDFWRKRIKYDLLVLKAEQLSEESKPTESDAAAETAPAAEEKDPRERLRRRYSGFARRMEQVDNDELLESFLTAITNGYDPHTSYMSPSALKNFRIMMGLKLEGIGAQLRQDPDDGRIIVARIVPGGAADKAEELKAEDKIISVGQGTDGEMVDVVDMKLDDVVAMIRGKAGTTVRLGVIPASGGDPVVYNITRAEIDLKDSAAQAKVFEAKSGTEGNPYKIGMIDLPSFYMDMEAARRGDRNYRSTTRDVRKILEDFRSQDVDAVVLDLRQNGGGSLTEAINLTGLFIDEGPVVQVADSENEVQHYDDTDNGMAWSGPLVVVISKFSASASEILAGAIQDYERGLVIGDEATHGKGTVQSLVDLGERLIGGPKPPNLGALKITMQQFFRPNGDSTQKRGVLSDIILPSVTNFMDVSESDLDYAFDFRRVRPTDYKPVHLVSQDLVNQLKAASDQRISQSEDFAKLLKRIELYRKQKARKAVTLNEAKFLAEREEFNAQKEDEKELEKQASSTDTIQRDYYLDEVFLITRDYAQALHQMQVAGVN
jgi:carboxyl-terminal processing protease